MSNINLYSKICEYHITNNGKFTQKFNDELSKHNLKKHEGWLIIKELLYEVSINELINENDIFNRKKELINLLENIYKCENGLYDWQNECLFKFQEDFTSIFNNKSFSEENKIISNYINKIFLKIFISNNNQEIYYLHNYLPKNCYNKLPPIWLEDDLIIDYKELSDKVLIYKNDTNPEVNNIFTNELMEAIVILSDSVFKNLDKIVLISVPSSKVNVTPQTKKSVEMIENDFKKGLFEFSSKKLLDLKYNNILKRTKNIVSQKDCGAYYRTVKNRHLKTISCSYDLPNSTGFIILDDVVTSGTTMESCKEILINHGAKEKNIVCLAIAKTIDCRHLKYHNGKVVLDEDS